MPPASALFNTTRLRVLLRATTPTGFTGVEATAIRDADPPVALAPICFTVIVPEDATLDTSVAVRL